MSRRFYIKKGDTAPPIEVICKDSNGDAVDISGASVRFHMKPIGGSQNVDAAATIVSAAAGHVRYSWQSADTATAGRYLAEFEVTYSGGGIESFPNNGNIEVFISDAVG